MEFSGHVIKELLQASGPQQLGLYETYALLPATRCRRRTHCCSVLPEMTLLEALAIVRRLVDMRPATRRQLTKNIISYFFLNAVEITSCPFLDGQDCLVYEDRFFGCRAYGLWSQEYYGKLAACSRQAKISLHKQWESMGVSLPQRIINFQVPYCLHVETVDHSVVDDETLANTSDRIESQSRHFSRFHQSFVEEYFSDLSFLLASLVFGFNRAASTKFAVVSDIVTRGNWSRLNRIVGELPDLCAELA